MNTSDSQHIALVARIEVLESENSRLKALPKQKHYFRIENICEDDKKVTFYTGFGSYSIFCAFFDFLGPVVNHLNYWGAREKKFETATFF